MRKAPPRGNPDPGIPARAFLKLSTCNVSDALDALGIQGAPRGILPLWPGCGKVAGPAVTMRLVARGRSSPVEGTLAAVRSARPGAVLVIDHGGRMDVNSWGGIAAFTALRRGISGVVIDGATRDVDEMRDLGFPAYGKGIIQQSIRGRCAFGGHGISVRLGDIPVQPGDLVMADENGVVIVPGRRVVEVLAIARRCSRSEERVKRWIARGVDPVQAHERAHYEEMPRTDRRRARSRAL